MIAEQEEKEEAAGVNPTAGMQRSSGADPGQVSAGSTSNSMFQ